CPVCCTEHFSGSSAERPDCRHSRNRSERSPMTPSVRSIQLASGVRLQYAEQGDAGGVPVVMLHGITDSWRSFESVMTYLPATLRVFALSQRGHGGSDHPGRYRTRDFAGDA